MHFFSVNQIKENLYIGYSGLILPKFSAWMKEVNQVIGALRAGGLINFFSEDPLPLESKMGNDIFFKVDDSNEKLSIDVFFYLFAFLLLGIILGLLCLMVEICVHKRQIARERARRKQRVAS